MRHWLHKHIDFSNIIKSSFRFNKFNVIIQIHLKLNYQNGAV